jgi:hypothetical protein
VVGVSSLAKSFEKHIVGIFSSRRLVSLGVVVNGILKNGIEFLFLLVGHQLGSVFVEQIVFNHIVEHRAFAVVVVDQKIVVGGIFRCYVRFKA